MGAFLLRILNHYKKNVHISRADLEYFNDTIIMFVDCELMIIGLKVSYFAMNHCGAVWFLFAQSAKEVKALLFVYVGFLFA